MHLNYATKLCVKLEQWQWVWNVSATGSSDTCWPVTQRKLGSWRCLYSVDIPSQNSFYQITLPKEAAGWADSWLEGSATVPNWWHCQWLNPFWVQQLIFSFVLLFLSASLGNGSPYIPGHFLEAVTEWPHSCLQLSDRDHDVQELSNPSSSPSMRWEGRKLKKKENCKI